MRDEKTIRVIKHKKKNLQEKVSYNIAVLK
jgi:hypothetical protein